MKPMSFGDHLFHQSLDQWTYRTPQHLGMPCGRPTRMVKAMVKPELNQGTFVIALIDIEIRPNQHTKTSRFNQLSWYYD